jgi:uncharacterized protein YndB with AHSA1/START domain
MTFMRVVSAGRDISAPAASIFELIADPARQPEWDGNGNLAEAATGQRVGAVGDVFATTITKGEVRENHVVEFVEGRRIAWQPAEEGGRPIGHLWRWELEPMSDTRTLVTHTYDWTQLRDEQRIEFARNVSTDDLRRSIERLAALVEQS